MLRSVVRMLLVLPVCATARLRDVQAQGPLILQGTLVRIHGTDTLPLIGSWVVAHRIGDALSAAVRVATPGFVTW